MPFARPGPSSSASTSRTPLAGLATPWDSDRHSQQVEAMRLEASPGIIAASPLSLGSNSYFTSSPASASRSVGMPLSSPPLKGPSATYPPVSVSRYDQPPKKKTLSRKQMLFQMSDDEEEKQEVEAEDISEEAVERQKEQEMLAKLLGRRSDPMRRSISALNGVTIIGKGSSRDSVSSQGSSKQGYRDVTPRTSIDEEPLDTPRHLPDRTRGVITESTPSASSPAPMSPPLADPPFAPKHGDAMNLGAALSLLRHYPATAASSLASTEKTVAPIRTSSLPSALPAAVGQPLLESGRAKPPLPRSVSVFTGAPAPASFQPEDLDQPPLTPISTSPSSSITSSQTSSRLTRPRMHSRASLHDSKSGIAMSPSFSTDSFALIQQEMSPTDSSSTALLASPMINDTLSPQEHGGPQSGSSVWENLQYAANRTLPVGIGRPPRTTSRRSSRGDGYDSTMGEGSSVTGGNGSTLSRSNTPRSESQSDLSQIARNFSRGRMVQSRKTSVEYGAEKDTLRRSTRTNAGNQSSTDLKNLIQQKRRQASAPFMKPLSGANFSPGTHTSPVLGTTSPNLSSRAPSPRLPNSAGFTSPKSLPRDEPLPQARRARSRAGTANPFGRPLSMSMSMSMSSAASNDGFAVAHTAGFEEERLRALRGIGGVVPTPSLEEWRNLGLDDTLRGGSSASDGSDGSSNSDRDESESESSRARRNAHSAGSVQPSANDLTPRPRLGSITNIGGHYGSRPPAEFVAELGKGIASANARQDRSSPSDRKYKGKKKSRYSDIEESSDDYGSDDGGSPQLERSGRREASQMMPTLSRQSLSAPTGNPLPGFSSPTTERTNPTETYKNGNASTGKVSKPTPIPLALTGPVDPRCYSAVTGLRSVDSFAVVGEAGKGAYGLVRKVRERGPDGQPFGPNLMLKYIVKQRILADAWKRHKILGAIPMEIHVLDHIRRVYRTSGHNAAVNDPILAASTFKLGSPPPSSAADEPYNVGHPNLCGMLDFFEDAENYYLVMPCFGSGQDLFDYVDAAPSGLSVHESRSILAQIVDGLAFLHMHGIVHRDIKDENVILDGHGGVQLIDFGSAAYIKEGKPYFDTFSGTLDFASPEVLRGERYGGKETDIWAFGVLAYVIICGECPFWTSEEAMVGLASGTRGEEALRAKADTVAEEGEEEGENYVREHEEDKDRGTAAELAEWGVDLVHQCLQVHSRDRPSAPYLKQHKLFVGEGGWLGKRGWESAVEEESSSDGGDGV